MILSLVVATADRGAITFYCDGSHGSTLNDPVIGEIATAHAKSPAQVMLRWGVQQRRSVVPKFTKPSRIAENTDVFDFELPRPRVDCNRRPGHRPSRRPRARGDHSRSLRPRNPG